LELLIVRDDARAVERLDHVPIIVSLVVTSYKYDEPVRRLVLGDAGRTFWK
jgi:hypothetical protein